MITTHQSIIIEDDTNTNDSFTVNEIHYEDAAVILASVVNEWYDGCFKVLIDKADGVVTSRELNFYYAKNI